MKKLPAIDRTQHRWWLALWPRVYFHGYFSWFLFSNFLYYRVFLYYETILDECCTINENIRYGKEWRQPKTHQRQCESVFCMCKCISQRHQYKNTIWIDLRWDLNAFLCVAHSHKPIDLYGYRCGTIEVLLHCEWMPTNRHLDRISKSDNRTMKMLTTQSKPVKHICQHELVRIYEPKHEL